MTQAHSSAANRDIVVIGASAGGVSALQALVKGLPKDFKGSLFVVLHIPAHSETQLPAILKRAGVLNAVLAKNGDYIVPGTIYIAPNDHHLLLEEGRVVVVKGPKENRFRPSIDALFRSAAYVYGPRVIGIILSGMLNDGASGLYTIKRQGGVVIIQDPQDAVLPQLPKNVMDFVEADFLSNASDMGALISALVSREREDRGTLSEEEMNTLKNEVIIAKNEKGFEMAILNMGELTPFTCPECHGTLVRLTEGNIIRFRCHTGHAYTASSLLEEVEESVEEMLWQTVRVLEEKSMLEKEIASHLERLQREESRTYHQRADETLNRSRQIHDFVFRQDSIRNVDPNIEQVPG
jgi:two-component system, chemotaxis family, protein-glutamate methylesterase/glutaminase